MNQIFLERKGEMHVFCDLYFSALTRRHIGAARTRDTSPAAISNWASYASSGLAGSSSLPATSEPSFGKPLLRQPVSLAVIAEQPNRRSRSAAEHEQVTGEWIVSQLLLAEPRQ